MTTTTSIKVALTGNVALELIGSYFRDAGYDVMPADVTMEAFKPEFVYDVTSHDAVLADETPSFRDERLAALAGSPYSAEGLRAIVDEFRWESLKAPKKVLAVDADNTLWHGILSEDGVANLKMCETLQAGLRRLADEGVVIVLLTKNDPPTDPNAENARLFASLDFCAAKEIGWDPKSLHLESVCRALNLPLDSVVFLDDNAAERAQMKAHLPAVTVVPWFGWNADRGSQEAERQLLRRLREYFFFNVGRTDEDRLRAADYARRGELAQRLAEASSRADFLTALGLWVRPGVAAEGDLDRLAQMAGKTNQFNATTLRRTRDEFAALLRDPSKRVFVFRAGDRFGEQGLVCYVVADLPSRRITDFVMSCRAMGRTLEHFALNFVTGALGFRPAIDFIPTSKNAPFAAFLTSLANGGQTATFYSASKTR